MLAGCGNSADPWSGNYVIMYVAAQPGVSFANSSKINLRLNADRTFTKAGGMTSAGTWRHVGNNVEINAETRGGTVRLGSVGQSVKFKVSTDGSRLEPPRHLPFWHRL